MSTINPEYLNANFELRVVAKDGSLVHDNYPLKFRECDLVKAQQLLQTRDWSALKDLSIPPEIP